MGENGHFQSEWTLGRDRHPPSLERQPRRTSAAVPWRHGCDATLALPAACAGLRSPQLPGHTPCMTFRDPEHRPEQIGICLVGLADAAAPVGRAGAGRRSPLPPTEAARRTNSSDLGARLAPLVSCTNAVAPRSQARARAQRHAPAVAHPGILGEPFVFASQIGHCTRAKNTGARWKSARAISMPVEISCPVRGHRIMTTPISRNLPCSENARDGVAGSGVLRTLFDRPEAALRQISNCKENSAARECPADSAAARRRNQIAAAPNCRSRDRPQFPLPSCSAGCDRA